MKFCKSHFTVVIVNNRKKKINKNCHIMCNKNPLIHNGLCLNELGCIHINPNDNFIDNSKYVWSIKNKQWKRLRYYNNHTFCHLHKCCVYWSENNDENCKMINKKSKYINIKNDKILL